MIRINLLPRERVQRRPIAPRLLLVVVGAALLVVVTAATPAGVLRAVIAPFVVLSVSVPSVGTTTFRRSRST